MFAEFKKFFEVNVRPKQANSYEKVQLVSVEDRMVVEKLLSQCRGYIIDKVKLSYYIILEWQAII